jgi:hypothetical protein
MPLSVKTLAAKVNDLEMEFAGEQVHIKYRSGTITSEWEAKFKGKTDGVFLQAHDLIVSWDLLDDSGKNPYPLDVKSLKQLPIEFIAAVISACAQDLVPNARTSTRSGDSSFGG